MSSPPTGHTADSATAVGNDTGPWRKRKRADRVTLNVGGQRFETTALTLCSSSSSYFTALFGSTGEALEGCADGEDIFIDRSGEIFPHVLQWLRSATLPAAVNVDALALADLRVEAEFYCMDALIAACQARLEELSVVPPPPPKPQARSFCVHIDGPDITWQTEPYLLSDWFELPEPGEGEVVYLHSAVMAGPLVKVERIEDKRSDEQKVEDPYARTGVYLQTNRHNFGGHNTLLYAKNDDLNAGHIDDTLCHHVVASRAVDIAGQQDQLVDLDFTQRIDLIVKDGICMAATGLADWHVHGWVGPPDAIPFVIARLGSGARASIYGP